MGVAARHLGAPLHLGKRVPQHRRHHEYMGDAIAAEHLGEALGAGHSAIVAKHRGFVLGTAMKAEDEQFPAIAYCTRWC